MANYVFRRPPDVQQQTKYVTLLVVADLNAASGVIGGNSSAYGSLTASGGLNSKVFGNAVSFGNETGTGSLASRSFGASWTRGDLPAIANLTISIFGGSIARGNVAGDGNISGRIAGQAAEFASLLGKGNLSGNLFGVSISRVDLFAYQTISISGRSAAYSYCTFSYTLPPPLFDFESIYQDDVGLHLLASDAAWRISHSADRKNINQRDMGLSVSQDFVGWNITEG